jgi:hypothetical protein
VDSAVLATAPAAGRELVDGNLVVSALQALDGKQAVQADGGVLTEGYQVLQGDWPLARWAAAAPALLLWRGMAWRPVPHLRSCRRCW